MTSPQAMLNFIAVRDLRLMRHVNRWQPPRWIRLWMICATRGGDGWRACGRSRQGAGGRLGLKLQYVVTVHSGQA